MDFMATSRLQSGLNSLIAGIRFNLSGAVPQWREKMNIKHLEVKRAYYADPENVVVEYNSHAFGQWMECLGEPLWDEEDDYRIKPKTIRIGEIDVPEPVRVALEVGQKYYIPSILRCAVQGKEEWRGDDDDRLWLSRGLIHLTREDAELHAKALILVSGGTTNGIDSGR